MKDDVIKNLKLEDLDYPEFHKDHSKIIDEIVKEINDHTTKEN